jgi:hypothetical protein
MQAASKNLAVILALLVLPSTLLGETGDHTPAPAARVSEKDDLDNILDHLEKKMSDQATLELPDTTNSSEKRMRSGSKKARDLAPETPGVSQKSEARQKSIKDIRSKISEYDNRIEILESDLRRLRANVYDASVTDNLVALEIRPAETAKFLIRDLRANLDGHTLYNRRDASGLWMPSKSIILFHGPLRPGDHQIDLSTVVVPLSPDGLKLPTPEHRTLDQSFRFQIPEGKQRRRLVLEISNTTDENPKPVARLLESEIK